MPERWPCGCSPFQEDAFLEGQVTRDAVMEGVVPGLVFNLVLLQGFLLAFDLNLNLS